MMINNIFYFIAGVLALAFSAGHAMWSQRNILGDVHASAMPGSTKHMLIVIWNQPTVFHFASAVGLLLAAIALPPDASRPLVVFIGLVGTGFMLNYVVTSLVRDRAALKPIIPQVVSVLIYLGIILAGG